MLLTVNRKEGYACLPDCQCPIRLSKYHQLLMGNKYSFNEQQSTKELSADRQFKLIIVASLLMDKADIWHQPLK